MWTLLSVAINESQHWSVRKRQMTLSRPLAIECGRVVVDKIAELNGPAVDIVKSCIASLDFMTSKRPSLRGDTFVELEPKGCRGIV